MKIKLFSLIIILSISIIYCTKHNTENTDRKEDTNNTFEDSIGIILVKNSSVRIQPYIYSAKITELKRGEKIKVTDRSAEKSYIGKKSAFWYKIILKNGISGWTYGGNIQIFKEGQTAELSSTEKEIEDKLKEKITSSLIGKWWSLNKQGDFTNYILIFWKDKKYLVKHKHGKEYKGTYTIDTKKSQIIFSEKTSLGNELHYLEQGNEIHLELHKKKYKINFKKISINPEDDEKDAEKDKGK